MLLHRSEPVGGLPLLLLEFLRHALTALTPASFSFLSHHLCIAPPRGPFPPPPASYTALAFEVSPNYSYLSLFWSDSVGQWALSLETFCAGQAPRIAGLGRLGRHGEHGGIVRYWALCSPVNTGVF